MTWSTAAPAVTAAFLASLVEVVEALPMTATGKILKRELS